MGLGPAVALLQTFVFAIVFFLAVFYIRTVRQSIVLIVVLLLYLLSGLAIVYSSTPEAANFISGHLLWLAAIHPLFGIFCIWSLVRAKKSAHNHG